jgi:hypothetical protein
MHVKLQIKSTVDRSIRISNEIRHEICWVINGRRKNPNEESNENIMENFQTNNRRQSKENKKQY